MRLVFLTIFLFLSACAPSNKGSTPQPYFYMHKKYIPSINDYVNYSGIVLKPNGNNFILNVTMNDFGCTGYFVYSSNNFRTPAVGETATIDGQLVNGDPSTSCLPQTLSFDLTNQDGTEYQLDILAETYLLLLTQ